MPSWSRQSRVLMGKRLVPLERIAGSLGWPDRGLFDELRQGFWLVGVQPDTRVFERDIRPMRPALVSKVGSSSPRSWVMSSGPVWLGLAPCCKPMNAMGLTGFQLGGSGSSTVDDFTECQVLEGLVRAGWEAAGGKFPFLTTLDLKAAYRQLPLAPDCKPLSMVALAKPDTREPMFFEMQALPFGASASVLHFIIASHVSSGGSGWSYTFSGVTFGRLSHHVPPGCLSASLCAFSGSRVLRRSWRSSQQRHPSWGLRLIALLRVRGRS